jgi:DNA-binding IclR family transcriptional regulator
MDDACNVVPFFCRCAWKNGTICVSLQEAGFGPMPTSDRESGMQSVARAVAVLDAIASHAEEGCRLADVIRETDLSKATAHRVVHSLECLGLVELDEFTERYFVGMHVVALGAAAGNRFGLVQRAQPSLRRLAERTLDTVSLTLRVGDEAVCVAQEEGDFPIKTLTLKVGNRRPLGIGSNALALLAFLPDPEVDRILGANAIAMRAYGMDGATMRETIEVSRRLGYALNDGRFVSGMSAVALGISTPDGAAVASIGVAAIDSRMKAERREDIVAWIREEVEKIEQDLAPLFRHSKKGARQSPFITESREAVAFIRGSGKDPLCEGGGSDHFLRTGDGAKTI